MFDKEESLIAHLVCDKGESLINEDPCALSVLAPGFDENRINSHAAHRRPKMPTAESYRARLVGKKRGRRRHGHVHA